MGNREVENKIIALYAKEFKFSENLNKHEDDCIKDKYDHNYFEYLNEFSSEELLKAINYQKDKGCNYIKFFGRTRLKDNHNLEEGINLTMQLIGNDTSSWKKNDKLSFHKSELNEVIEMELRAYAKVYGEDFARRNVERLYSKQDYVGAYIGDKLVGSCLIFVDDEYVNIDEILVDEDYRNQYVCTSLIKHIVDKFNDKKIILHADNDDTPKQLYKKLGFEVIDQEYYYYLGLNI